MKKKEMLSLNSIHFDLDEKMNIDERLKKLTLDEMYAVGGSDSCPTMTCPFVCVECERYCGTDGCGSMGEYCPDEGYYCPEDGCVKYQCFAWT